MNQHRWPLTGPPRAARRSPSHAVVHLATWLLLIASALASSASSASGEAVDLLVIAPHPDDEVLMAGGVLERAVRAGTRPAVVIVTNGDLSCERNGWQRMAESVAALAHLGVPEEAVHFLGYPDGALELLSPTPLGPRDRATPDGGCEQASGTYADRGELRRDEHTRRTGRPAPWTSTALTEDLAELLRRLRPAEVYVPHPIDQHPDHAATYVYFRRALDAVDGSTVTVHRSVIHAGPCWPGDCRTHFQPKEEMPPLPAPLEAYRPKERWPVDPAVKLATLALYPSQIGPHPQDDWLAAFARREEVFFPELLVRQGRRWDKSPRERVFTVRLGAHTSLTIDHEERLEVRLGVDRATLSRHTPDGLVTLASWALAEPGPFTLLVEGRPEDGEVSEWSLVGPHGLIGLHVCPVLVTHLRATGEVRASEKKTGQPRHPTSNYLHPHTHPGGRDDRATTAAQ